MFRKSILGTAIAGCIFAYSSNVFALDVTINGNKTISTEKVEQIIVEQNIASNDSVAIAKAILAMYQKQGFIGTKINVNKSKGVITVNERKINNGGGKYSEYFPTEINESELNTIYARMKAELNANNEKIHLVLSDSENSHEATLKTKVTKTNRPTESGLITLTNIGSKYTSSYIVTAQGIKKLGDGMTIDGTLSKGLPGLSDDSSGGDLTVVEANLSKHTKYGSTNLSVTRSLYEVGGEYEDFGVKGDSTKLNLGHEYILNDELTLSGGLNAYFSNSAIDAGGLNSNYDYRSVFAEAKVNQGNMQITANIEHGLSGSERYNVTPIHGSFDDTFTIFSVDGKHSMKVKDIIVTSKLGFQNSTDGTPSDKRFAIGGKDRGSSFSSGFVTVKSGVYGSITAKKKVKSFMLSAGVDGAAGTSMTDERHSVASAFVSGQHFYKEPNIYIDGVLSKNIGADINGQNEYKVSLVLTKLF